MMMTSLIDIVFSLYR